MTLVRALLAEVAADPAAIRDLAELLAPHMPATEPATPWLDVDQAAGYLACKRQRIYDLVHSGRLEPARDGKRLLFRRDHLDAYLATRSAA